MAFSKKSLKRKIFEIPTSSNKKLDTLKYATNNKEMDNLQNYKNYTIAISSITSGAGCTFTALNIAFELSERYKVALVELDEKDELRNFEEIYSLKSGEGRSKKLDRVDIFFYEKSNLLDVFQYQYDYIIMDTGIFMKSQNGVSTMNPNINEILRANKRVLVANIHEWKVGHITKVLEILKDIYRWTITANLASYDRVVAFARTLDPRVRLIHLPYVETFTDDMRIAARILKGGD